MGMTPWRGRGRTVDRGMPREVAMYGWLLWGLVLPILVVVAGIITIRRGKGRR